MRNSENQLHSRAGPSHSCDGVQRLCRRRPSAIFTRPVIGIRKAGPGRDAPLAGAVLSPGSSGRAITKLVVIHLSAIRSVRLSLLSGRGEPVQFDSDYSVEDEASPTPFSPEVRRGFCFSKDEDTANDPDPRAAEPSVALWLGQTWDALGHPRSSVASESQRTPPSTALVCTALSHLPCSIC